MKREGHDSNLEWRTLPGKQNKNVAAYICSLCYFPIQGGKIHVWNERMIQNFESGRQRMDGSSACGGTSKDIDQLFGSH